MSYYGSNISKYIQIKSNNTYYILNVIFFPLRTWSDFKKVWLCFMMMFQGRSLAGWPTKSLPLPHRRGPAPPHHHQPCLLHQLSTDLLCPVVQYTDDTLVTMLSFHGHEFPPVIVITSFSSSWTCSTTSSPTPTTVSYTSSSTTTHA